MVTERSNESEEQRANCWELLGCGREPGGKASQDAVCPVALEITADGINRGKNAGRICWTVADTLCFGRHQPSVTRKRPRCQLCRFFHQVRREEGTHFQLIKFPDHLRDEAKQNERIAWLRGVINNLARLLTDCQDIMRHVELDALLRAIADQAGRACNAERGAIYVFDPAECRLVAQAVSGHSVVGYSIPLADNSVPGYVAQHDTFLNIIDTSEDLSYIVPPLYIDSDFRQQYRFHVCNVLAVPIHGEPQDTAREASEGTPSSDIIGVIEVVNKREGHFTEDDEWFLAEVAVIAGLALQSAQQFEELRKMRHTDREKSRFVALLMHQIVSPLATVYTCVSALTKLRDRISSEDAQALADGALKKVVKVQELSKKLLDLTAIQEGRALAECKDIDVVAILRAEAENHKEAAEGKKIRLRVEVTEASSHVHADPTGLGVILANLLQNAIKYSDSGTEIVVSEHAENGHFFASVKDQGSGIADKDLDRIFEEFFRCGDAARKGLAGSGLGLSFVKALVARYGGSIHVDSTVGQGSVFTVSFPCC